MQTAKLFPNGQSQLRLPKEYRFEGDRAYIRRLGGAVVLLSYQEPWQVLFDSLDQFSADYAAEVTSSIRDNVSSWEPETQPAQQGTRRMTSQRLRYARVFHPIRSGVEVAAGAV